MRIWPWCVLADAKAARDAAEISRISGQEAVVKAGNIWKETRENLAALDGMLAAADFRIPRDRAESFDDYKLKLAKILHEGRKSQPVLAILDRLDAKTREGFRFWLVEPDAAKAEILRQRASALADFRAELVMALYELDLRARREELHRQGQEHARIYKDGSREPSRT